MPTKNDKSDSRQVATLTPGTRGELAGHDDLASDEDTFVEALAFNASLNAAEAMATTVVEALAQLPRRPYPPIRRRRVERRGVRNA